MATNYTFSTITDGATLSFNPATDTLSFDDESISAASLVLTYSATFTTISFSAGGKSFSITSSVELSELTTTNVSFADGSQLLVGDFLDEDDNQVVNNTLTGTDFDDQLLGLTGKDTLAGGEGSDVLDGGTGSDVMIGGAGNDHYVVDSTGDVVNESASVAPLLVSIDSAGAQATARSSSPQISADGGTVVFFSEADLADISDTADNNVRGDIYVRNSSGLVNRASLSAEDSESNEPSFDAQVNDDGQYVLFTSLGSDLVASDNNGTHDIFVKNMETGAIQRASVTTSGVEANGTSGFGRLTADGRSAVFESTSTNLVTGDTNSRDDIFFKRLDPTRTLERISTSSDGTQGNGDSMNAHVSADGRFVVFDSSANNLVTGDTNNRTDVFLKDRNDGSLVRVSTNADGEQGNDFSSHAQVSDDGSSVLFQSDAGNLIVNDSTDNLQIFLKHLGSGEVVLVSSTASGVQGNDRSQDAMMSADGRFVVFKSDSSNLVAGDSNDSQDVFVKDLQTGAIQRVSVNANGAQAEQFSSYVVGGFSADGTRLVFSSSSNNLVTGDSFSGEDVFKVSNPFLVTSGGIDDVRSSISHTLATDVENLVLTGGNAINGTGNAASNSITGNTAANRLGGANGNDTLIGGGGNDTLTGGAGNDSYGVNDSSDVIDEASDSTAEIDSVNASLSWTLGANLENLTLTGTNAINGTGNTLANKLTGNGDPNRLTGDAGKDTLNGGGGKDTLDGGSGNDSMTGGSGNDSYLVNSSGDKAIETSSNSSEIDSVSSNISWTLGSNLEKLTLSGSNAVNGTGNSLANSLSGNDGANTLAGNAGNDTLLGGGGADSLYGSSGGDSLDGGSGNDTLVGHTGNDIYVVGSSGDLINETSTLATEIDNVFASLTWTLGSNLERLELLGGNAINGSGNGLDNRLTGNTGNNTLWGKAGNDTLTAHEGNDTLTGGSGLDSFRISRALDGSDNVDTITDFLVADDRIELEHDIFLKLPVSGTGTMSASSFKASTSGNASDSNDYVLYETDTGKLFYDADGSGSGAKVLFAVLTGLPTLTAGDIFVT